MPGIAALIIKIMPDSPESNMNKIQQNAIKALENQGAQNLSFEIKEVAFGLKSLTVKMAWPEDKDTDIAENSLSELENVSSVSIEDYRRAFG